MKDKQVEQLIKAEKNRQTDGLELIPSENYVSPDVLKALGSVFTNKYSEGYPGRRYYGGQENTDQIEQLAIDRAKKLFGADHANVQPHSGAQANEAVYYAWCEPGDTILAMDLAHGGHLTHGAPVTRSAREYNFIRYGIKDVETGEIDYEEIRRLALKHRPKIILAGFSAYPRELDYAKFAEIGNEVGAMLMADMSHIAGLIVGGVAKNPFDYGFHVITTTTHKTLRGPRGGLILSKGIVSNPLKRPEKTLENLPTLIDRAVFPGTQGGPHMHTIAAKAVAMKIAGTEEFRERQERTVRGAAIIAERLGADDVRAAGVSLVTGGTDVHLVLVDLRDSSLDGQQAEDLLHTAGITVNRNAVPFDPRPPRVTSGLRIGTPALATRGFGDAEFTEVADIIAATLVHGAAGTADDETLAALRGRVRALTDAFPLYPGLAQ